MFRVVALGDPKPGFLLFLASWLGFCPAEAQLGAVLLRFVLLLCCWGSAPTAACVCRVPEPWDQGVPGVSASPTPVNTPAVNL